MAYEAEGTNNPFMDITSQQREFILTITNALAKYGSESSGQSEKITFLQATDQLISETVRLDYALRTVGSGGPGMERANVFRNLLRVLRESLSDSSVKADLSKTLRTLRDLDNTTAGLHTALEDFISITFNEKLMDSLNKLGDTLKKYYYVGAVPFHSTIHLELEHDLTASFASLQKHLEKFVDEGMLQSPMCSTTTIA